MIVDFVLVEPEQKTVRAQIHATMPLTAEEKAAFVEARKTVHPAPRRPLFPVPPPVIEEEA